MRYQKHLPLFFLPLLSILLFTIPDSSQGEASVQPTALHDSLEYTNTIAPFNKVFRLYMTREVWSPHTTETEWSTQDVEDFMNAILGPDPTQSIFWLVQEYCLPDEFDAKPAYDEIDFPNVDIIRIDVLDSANTKITTANSTSIQIHTFDTPLSPTNNFTGTTTAHELAHLMHRNYTGLSRPLWADETHAAMIEAIIPGHNFEFFHWTNFDEVTPLASTPYYDITPLRNQGPTGPTPYWRGRTIAAYLLEHFNADTTDITDDLLYQWKHSDGLQWDYLGDAMEEVDHLYTFPGATPDERVGNLFHKYSLALYANDNSYQSGQYGFGDVDVRSLNLFEWVNSYALQVRTVAPFFTVGATAKTESTFVGLKKPSQAKLDTTAAPRSESCRTRQLEVSRWSAEYIVLRCDPDHYPEGSNGHTLEVNLSSRDAVPQNSTIRIGYLAYGVSDSVLYDDTLLDVVESIPVSLSGGKLNTTFTVPDFGSDYRGIAVVASLVDSPIGVQNNCTDNYGTTYQGPCYPTGSCWADSVRLRVSYEVLPDTLGVPAAGPNLNDVIGGASSNTRVEVSESATPYQPIMMAPYIQVVAAEGESPVIRGTSTDSVVVFPEGTTTSSILQGFSIEGISTTKDVVVFQGSGQLLNCAVSSDGDSLSSLINTRDIPAIEELDVTIKNCSLSGAGGADDAAIYVGYLADNVTIDSTSVEFWGEDTYGVKVTDFAHISLTNSLIKGPEVGIELGQSGGYLIYGDVSNCTVDSTGGAGIAGNNTVFPERCIVTNAQLDGAGTYGITQTAYDCIVSDGMSGAPSGGNVYEDPLYCNGAYSLRVDSYGNPWNNPDQELIGAYSVACWDGTLQRKSHFEGGTLTVSTSPIVGSSDTLTFGPATTVQVSSGKELRVQGTLEAAGTSQSPISFEGSTPTAGYWDCLRLSAASRIGLEYVDIKHSEDGIANNFGVGSVDSLYMENCNVSEFTDNGLYINHQSVSMDGYLRLQSVDIDMDGAVGSGIWIGREYSGNESYGPTGLSVDLDNITVTGDADGAYGIYINNEGSGGSDASVRDISVSGLTMGTGIKVGDLSARITADSGSDIAVDDCKVGIALSGSGAPELSGISATYKVTIEDCTTGLSVDASSPEIEWVSITSPSGGTGILTGGYSAASFLDVDVAGGAKGMYAQSVSPHTFREGSLVNYSSYGVLVGTAAYPHFGEGSDHGDNNIYSSSGLPAKAKTLGQYGVIKAEYNWWGSDPPPTMVNIDYTPWLTSLSTLENPVRIVQVPTALRVLASPNPMRMNSGSLRLELPSESGKYRLEVFGVDGRLVQTLTEGVSEIGGIVEVSMSQSPTRLVSGIYFLRLSTQLDKTIAKVVVIP